MLDTINHKNILLNQILFTDETSYSIREVLPLSKDNESIQSLSRDQAGNIFWIHIDNSLNLLVNNRFVNTNIFYDNNGRIGLNRYPLFNYKIDIAVPKNTLMTAFHIGDGSFGFSMGNGTTDGFVPEIIGMSSNKDDPGLYFIGRTLLENDIDNEIPLIVLDGRTKYGKIKNRPILGVSNCDYHNCVVLIDNKGNIFANDLIINNISLIKKIQELENEINKLKEE